MSGRGIDTGITYSTFGTRASTSLAVGRYTLVPALSAGYRHAFGSVTQTVHQRFAVGGGDFDTAGAVIAKDAAVVSAGVKLDLTDRMNVNLSYVGQYGSKYEESGVRGKIALKF
ncbi:hypothetical protein AA14337_2935 [Acetobacter malorum DSM 14337]|uniref:Autotransporter domain-containing protein n=1 Tax=Acetobacter malorum DSM 14337 TaxID=1307910 RepID=A0ABQ0PYN7_9PROT|nr:hypothetical protein AA14337_2935 [Acetobacter malorum DSM 14337]